MNCEKFQTVVTELAREQMIEAGERSSALAHVASCENCAIALEDEINLTLDLQTLAGEMKDVSAPASLENKMLAAFRERNSKLPVKPVNFATIANRRQNRNYWFAAVAAMLILTLGLFILRGVLNNSPLKRDANVNLSKNEIVAGTPANPASPPVPLGNGTKGLEIKPVGQVTERPAPKKISPKSIIARHQPKAIEANTIASTAGSNSVAPATAEITTDFFPIGYTSTPNLQEGGQLLRVELPRTAVARFGLPVNMDRANQRVKADVLVGSDGLAQAIRFVQ